MSRLVTFVEWLSKALFTLSSLLLLFMTLSVTCDVLLRYFIKKPTIWVNEISGYMLVSVAFLGAAYTLKAGGHVKVDVLYEKASRKIKHILTVIAYCLTLGYILVLTVKGLQMVELSFSNHWHASTLLGTPLFIPQAAIPLGGLVIVLQILVLLRKEFLALRSDKTS